MESDKQVLEKAQSMLSDWFKLKREREARDFKLRWLCMSEAERASWWEGVKSRIRIYGEAERRAELDKLEALNEFECQYGA